MPFLEETTDVHPKPLLRQVAPNTFRLESAFRYREGDREPILVPAHAAELDGTTDIASVPWVLW